MQANFTPGMPSWSARELDFSQAFPSIEEELGPFRHHFTGKVLNAGAGERDIAALVDGQLYNQDIFDAPHIDFQGPLHEIPVDDGFFDTIVCNAVLEHVENPEEVMTEFHRVCRPGGTLYLTVPFMQPYHPSPTDFQRYTLDGLRTLVERFGFTVTESGGVHSSYQTLAWIARDWLAPKRGFLAGLLKWTLFPYLLRKCRTSTDYVDSIASAYRVIAVRS
jgi:SAM-dependent methyltransferase